MSRISSDVEKPSLISVIDSLPPREKSLLSKIETITETTKGKIAYQQYFCKLGLETVDVLIPLKESKVFDGLVDKVRTRVELLRLVNEHQGKIV